MDTAQFSARNAGTTFDIGKAMDTAVGIHRRVHRLDRSISFQITPGALPVVVSRGALV